MRREGFELSIGRPKVLYKMDENNKKTEPIEHLFVDVMEEFSGIVIKTL
jgi:GTP-binding protein